MAKRKALDLSVVDDKLLDGLKFCMKIYDLFDQVRSEPDGIGKNQVAVGQTGEAAS